jgi:hypothetical protein
MGLDQYLSGKKTFGGHWGSSRVEDGMPVETISLSLGYWRKHWALHNYIAEKLDGSNGDGSHCELCVEHINELIDAYNAGEIVEDEWSAEENAQQKDESLKIFGKALVWMTFAHDPPSALPTYKYFEYTASW